MAKSLKRTRLAPEVMARYEPSSGPKSTSTSHAHQNFLRLLKRFVIPRHKVCPSARLARNSPVLNKRAVEMAMRAALALNWPFTSIPASLAKIISTPTSQGLSNLPIRVSLATGGGSKSKSTAPKNASASRPPPRRRRRKNLHEASRNPPPGLQIQPLALRSAEIVSEPTCASPWRPTPTSHPSPDPPYTGVSDVNMEEGSLRCDATSASAGSKEFAPGRSKNLTLPLPSKTLDTKSSATSRLDSAAASRKKRASGTKLEAARLMRSKKKATTTAISGSRSPTVHVSRLGDEIRAPSPNSRSQARPLRQFLRDHPYDAEVLTNTQATLPLFRTRRQSRSPRQSRAT